MRRFRLRRLWRVNCEAQMRAAGQNLKRLLKKRGWGRRPWPQGAADALSEPLPQEHLQLSAPVSAEQALACEQYLHVKKFLKSSFIYQSCLLFCQPDASRHSSASFQGTTGPILLWIFSASYDSLLVFLSIPEYRL